MALIDEVRFSLRITEANNTALNTELQRYIDEAILDLTRTTDIKEFDATTDDALLKGAIIAYAEYRFELDVTRKSSYKATYDDMKEKLLMSSSYSTLGGEEDVTT